MLVSMSNIIEYLGDGVRPLKEGLNLFKSQHVINIGRSNSKKGLIDIQSQVIQTTNPRGLPHNVKISGVGGTNSKSWIAVCSCKGGLGHKCKHIFATLLYIHHSNENFDILSSTDVTQKWGVTKRELSVQPFDAKLFSQLCCVQNVEPARKLSAEIKASIFKRMVDAAPDSSVALHYKRQRILTPIEPIFEKCSNKLKHEALLDSIFHIPTGQYVLKPFVLPAKGTHLMNFYFEKVYCNLDNVKDINYKTIGQRNTTWKLERRKRVTASDAYKLFTYSNNKNPNWPKKISEYFNPSNFQSPAMRYGSETENLAFSVYEQHIKCEIVRMGFVVSPALPWLGCSVDGYIPSLKRIVEFKCPVLGATQDIADVLPHLNYLTKDLSLKVKHMYFCQVQLGMSILNAQSCDFVVYCKHKQQMHIVTIPIDADLANKYTKVLYKVYFDYMLPTVINGNNYNS